MNITKKRDGDAWRLHIDGRPTAMLISKAPPPRYREPQEYDLTLDDADQTFLFTSNSLGRVVSIIERIAQELTP